MPIRKTGLTKEKLEAISRELSALPAIEEKRELSLKESVDTLKPVILGLRNRGYTVEDIAKEFSKRGLKVSPHTLKLYARTPRKKSKVKE